VRSRRREKAVRSSDPSSPWRPRGQGGDGFGLNRREVLAGGIGAGALVALPDLRIGDLSGARSGPSGQAALRYVFLYGTPGPAPGGSLVATTFPASRTAPPPTPVPVAVNLAAAPVLSPDQAVTAISTVDMVAGRAEITLTLLDATSAAVAQQGSVTLPGIPADANVLVTPVFAPGSAIVSLVLAITMPAGKRMMSKAHPGTGSPATQWATTWVSHHALAYFDRRSGAMTGPFHLSGEPSLALTTAAANASDLVLWTAREPRADDPAGIRAKATLSQLTVFPLGSGTPRWSGPVPSPWPGGEPVITLLSGDVARLVRGREVQVCSARTGEVTGLGIPAFSPGRAKPSAVTMQARSDGTVFMTKPGAGVAVIADPAEQFRTTAQIQFPLPATPLGAPWTKAVLSPAGDTCYVLGPAAVGGISVYDVASGKMAGSYSDGSQYAGLYQLPSGALLAVRPENPRLAFFSAGLSPLGTADTNLDVSAVY
jgi:hypothetical protein